MTIHGSGEGIARIDAEGSPWPGIAGWRVESFTGGGFVPHCVFDGWTYDGVEQDAVVLTAAGARAKAVALIEAAERVEKLERGEGGGE